MSSKKIKAALLGAGHISEFHIRALRRLPHVDIIGIADLDLSRAQQIATQHQIPFACGSVDELLMQDPDVVHILTPPGAHAESTIKALEHGCHVMVEKPLADGVDACHRIADAVQASGKLLCVDHSLLRDPFIVHAMQLIDSGAIGKVVSVDHLRSQRYPHYVGGPVPEMFRDGGYPFRDIGVHSLYLMEAFLGKIRNLDLRLGTPETDGNPRFKEWRALVECEQGIGNVYLSWNSKPLQNVFIIHGTEGVIRADLFGMSVTIRRSGKLPGHAERVVNSVREGTQMIGQVVANVTRVLRKRLRQYHGLQELVIDFYDAISTETTSPVDVHNGTQAVYWTEKAAIQADQAKLAYEQSFANQGTARILLTGATGFIGQHLLRQLLTHGDKVRLLVRRTPPAEFADHPNVEIFLGDLGDSASVSRAMSGIQTVYHLGATVEGESEDFQCGTIVGTNNIVDACIDHKVSKLIYMSSLAVIDAASAARSKTAIREDHPFEPFPQQRGLYTQTKLDAEHIVLEAVRSRGLRAVILRPGEVFGPNKNFLSGAVGRAAAGRVIVLGGGKSNIPAVWVDDLVDAILASAEIDQFDGTVFNIVDPELITQDELARHFMQVQGKTPRLLHFPTFVLYPTALGLRFALGLLGKQSPITPYRLRSAIGNRRFDCSKAKNELRWQPKLGIRAGLKLMIPSHPDHTINR